MFGTIDLTYLQHQVTTNCYDELRFHCLNSGFYVSMIVSRNSNEHERRKTYAFYFPFYNFQKKRKVINKR